MTALFTIGVFLLFSGCAFLSRGHWFTRKFNICWDTDTDGRVQMFIGGLLVLISTVITFIQWVMV